jgi:hypothetical protein
MCGTSLDPTKSARPNSSPTFGMANPHLVRPMTLLEPHKI